MASHPVPDEPRDPREPGEPGALVVVSVVLAAGGGTRFVADHHKLTTLLDGRPLVAHAVDHALAGSPGPVVVVRGAIDLPLGDLRERVIVVDNPAWAEGQSTSVAAAVAAADELGADHVVIGLGDQPGIPAAAWHRIATAPPTWPIVVASYDGRRGPHPVRLHRSVWPMLPAAGDDGGRQLMREHPSLVHEVACPGTAADIDTLEDVQRWRSS